MARQNQGYDTEANIWRSLTTDEDGCLKGITHQNYILDRGLAFQIGNYFDVTGSSTFDLMVHTPTAGGCHFSYEILTESEATMSFYENATTTNDGTTITCFNLNRTSANSCTMAYFNGPTLSTVGTLLEAVKSGSGQKAGAEIAVFKEWVLKGDTKYILRLENSVATANWMSYKMVCYANGI